MGLEVTKLEVSPDGYYPGLLTDMFITPMIRSFIVPEVRAATEAVMDYLEGDEEPIWALIDERTGLRLLVKEPGERIKLKAPLKTILRTIHLIKGEELEIPDVVRFLAEQADKIEEHARARRMEGEAARFSSDSRDFPELKQALSEYKKPEEEILRAVFLAEQESTPGEPTTLGKIEDRIVRGNQPFRLGSRSTLKKLRKTVEAAKQAHAATEPDTQEHQQTKQALRDAEDRLEKAQAPVVFSHERYPLFEDASALAEFAAKHDKLLLDEMRRKAPLVLSKQQLEVFRLADAGLDNKEIAEELDRSADQIGVVKHQAFKTLRRAVGL